MEETLFSTVALAEILSQIEELKSYDIEVKESVNGGVTLSIGNSKYGIVPIADTVEVSNSVMETVVNNIDNEYEELIETIDAPKSIESGVITKLFKTLLVGGAVKLISKLTK